MGAHPTSEGHGKGQGARVGASGTEEQGDSGKAGSSQPRVKQRKQDFPTTEVKAGGGSCAGRGGCLWPRAW